MVRNVIYDYFICLSVGHLIFTESVLYFESKYLGPLELVLLGRDKQTNVAVIRLTADTCSSWLNTHIYTSSDH